VKIAVLGTGAVGRTLAGGLDDVGHELTIATRDHAGTRRREDYAAWAADHPGVALAGFGEASAAAEVVVVAVSGTTVLDVLADVAPPALSGTVLVDVSNPLDFSTGFPPRLFTPTDDSLAEQVQRAHPLARVVKTLNTLTAELMVHPERLGEPTTVFLSGDDPAAKEVVGGLLDQLGHRDVLDLGGIETARGPEQYLLLWLGAMQALGTASFNLRIVR
jgi:predicted dinucleotide-binding enzyme